jgi:hypothetical protein
MTARFHYTLMHLNLSQKQAAKVLDVSKDTVKSWSAGRRTVPQRIWDKLTLLHWDMDWAIKATKPSGSMENIDIRAEMTRLKEFPRAATLPEPTLHAAVAIAFLRSRR